MSDGGDEYIAIGVDDDDVPEDPADSGEVNVTADLLAGGFVHAEVGGKKKKVWASLYANALKLGTKKDPGAYSTWPLSHDTFVRVEDKKTVIFSKRSKGEELGHFSSKNALDWQNASQGNVSKAYVAKCSTHEFILVKEDEDGLGLQIDCSLIQGRPAIIDLLSAAAKASGLKNGDLLHKVGDVVVSGLEPRLVFETCQETKVGKVNVVVLRP